jgi:Flp pilus assembly protein TadG
MRPARDRGVSAVEFSIIALPLLLLVFLVVQVALWYWGRTVALQAARQGLSQLRLYSDYSQFQAAQPRVDGSVDDYVNSLSRAALTSAQEQSGWLDAQGNPIDRDQPGPVSVRVEVHGDTISLVPFLHLSTTQVVTGRVERFLPDTAP